MKLKCRYCKDEFDDLVLHFESCTQREEEEPKVQCPVCNGWFKGLLPHLVNKKSCREKLGESKLNELREEARKLRVSKKKKKYSQSEQGKEAQKRYSYSYQGKLTKKIYNHSRKGDATQDRYNLTEKARARQRKYLDKLRWRDYDKNRDYQILRKRKHLAKVGAIWHVIDVLLDSVMKYVSSKAKDIDESSKRRRKRKKSNREPKRFRGRDLKLDGLKDCFMCKQVKSDHIMGLCEACRAINYPVWEIAKKRKDWQAMHDEEREAKQRPEKFCLGQQLDEAALRVNGLKKEE